MARYKFTNKAVEDLSNIWIYTVNKWSESQADIYYGMLIETCEEAAKSPNLGRDYSNVTAFLLGIKSGRHIIFYQKVAENQIEIIRILHEQMDLENRLKGEK
jgi:toxin ParE1/3/4